MAIYVSSAIGFDFYLDGANNVIPNLNPTNVTPLATISRAIELLREKTITEDTIILKDGVYRESVVIPQDFIDKSGLSSLKIESESKNAGMCIISGADMLTTPTLCALDTNNIPTIPGSFKIFNCEKFITENGIRKIVNSSITEGWDYMGDHTYRIKNWEYIFSEEELDIIQAARKAHFVEANKNNFLTSYAIKNQIRKNFSERQFWIFKRLQDGGTIDLRDNSTIPPVSFGNEIHQVFELADLRPGTFFVSQQNDEDVSDVLWSTGFPDGVYIKLPNHLQTPTPAIFDEFVLLASKRARCLTIESDNISIEYVGFRLSASPVLKGAVEVTGDKNNFISCNSTWNRGYGFVSQGTENHFIGCLARYNSQEGMVFGNASRSSIICNNRTNNNSLAYRYLNILPPTHANKVGYPGYSNGGLILKGGEGHIVVNHESLDNLGNGIWADYAAKIRIFGGIIERNFGSGITIERTTGYFEVAHTTIRENYGPGIRVEGVDSYIHHNIIVGNKRDALAVSVGKDSTNTPLPTTVWIMQNTLAGNLRGIGVVGDNSLKTISVGNIVSCCQSQGIYILGGPYNQMDFYDNLFNRNTFTGAVFFGNNLPTSVINDLESLNIFGKPLFNESCAGDYSLDKDSPAIGGGNGNSFPSSVGVPNDLLDTPDVSICSSTIPKSIFKDIGAIQ